LRRGRDGDGRGLVLDFGGAGQGEACGLSGTAMVYGRSKAALLMSSSRTNHHAVEVAHALARSLQRRERTEDGGSQSHSQSRAIKHVMAYDRRTYMTHWLVHSRIAGLAPAEIHNPAPPQHPHGPCRDTDVQRGHQRRAFRNALENANSRLHHISNPPSTGHAADVRSRSGRCIARC